MDKSPDAFRTISEVAEVLETPAHVLRFWESRFPQIRPVKRAGGRRYYRPADVALLTGIKHLLHDEGMTIRGVQKILREQGVRHVSGVSDDAAANEDDTALEAALAASGGPSDPPEALPPAEAETAQIIALQTALGQSEDRREAVPEPDDDLFARLARATAPEDAPESAPADVESETTPAENQPFEKAAERSSSGTDTDFVPEQVASVEPPVEEAPMQVWAEPEPAPEADPISDPAPVVPALRITRIGVPPPPAGIPAPTPDITLPGMAQRLRATLVADLSPSDRATLAILRAKARSLRGRLGNQPRTGL